MVSHPEEAADEVAVREALARGFVSHQQVREALLLREELKRTGRSSGLLAILEQVRPTHGPT